MNALRSFLLMSLLLSSPSWGFEIKVNDSRGNNFYMDALIWVLEKSEADYQLIHTNHSMSSQVRKVSLVKSGELDVMYSGTSRKMEAQLMPIRFPITRGFIGRRLLLINKNYQDNYNQIRNFDHLKMFTGILSFGWPEKEIFEAAGLPQVEKLYNDIFISLNDGSRYYFSRGVLEIFSELLHRQEQLPNLVVDKQLLLTYKSAVFFFINPNNKELEAALKLGFEKGYADGSYKKFFYNHPLIKKSFEKANVDSRIVINIPNPFFPETSNSIPDEYWH